MTKRTLCTVAVFLNFFRIAHASDTEAHTTFQTIRVPLRKKIVVLNIDNAVGGINQNNITQINSSTQSNQYSPHRVRQAPDSSNMFFGTPAWRTLATRLWQNKMGIIIAVVGAAYSTFLGALYYHAHAITNQDSWSSWHGEIPLAALMELPRDEVIHELHHALTQRYMTDNAPLTAADSIYYFMRDIKKELQHCALLIQSYEWIHHFNLTLLAPTHSDAREHAHTAQERLLFLQQILNESVARS